MKNLIERKKDLGKTEIYRIEYLAETEYLEGNLCLRVFDLENPKIESIGFVENPACSHIAFLKNGENIEIVSPYKKIFRRPIKLKGGKK